MNAMRNWDGSALDFYLNILIQTSLEATLQLVKKFVDSFRAIGHAAAIPDFKKTLQT